MISKKILNLSTEYALYFLAFGVCISNGFASLGMSFVLLCWGLQKLRNRLNFSELRFFWTLAGFLFLAYTVSLIHSAYLGQSVYALFLKHGKNLLLMFAVAESVREKRVAKRWAFVLCLTMVVVCLDGLYQFFSGRDLLLSRQAGRLDVFYEGWEFHSFRITATFPAANTLASFLVPVLALGIALSFLNRTHSTKPEWGSIACLGTMVLCLLLTFSRGGLIACIGSISLLAFLFRKKVLLLISVIILVVFLLGNKLYGNRAAQEGAIDPTVKTRLFMLKDAARMFRSHPWTGIGLNTYYKTHERTRSLAIPPSYAHNSYIQMIAEVGIIGFMSFIALMIYWFRCGFRSFMRSRDMELKFLLAGVLAGILGLCVASLFDNVLYELLPATLFWVLMGYGIALTKIGRENGDQ